MYKGLINRGFTLIELLVVISIISLLSSVILVSVNSAKQKSRDTLRLQHFSQIRTALNLYASDNQGQYPAGNYYSSWTTQPYAWSNLATLLAPYISPLPTDPSGNSATRWYYYAQSFRSGSISSANGNEGTCLNKRLLFLNASEGTVVKKDCQFAASLEAQYPNAFIMVIE